jgi:hypothetical protein
LRTTADPPVRQPAEPTRIRTSTAVAAVLVPLTWGIVLLFHPTGEGELFYPILRDQATPWIVVHLATMVFIPLMGLVLYVLLQGIDSQAAQISRLAIPVFAVVFTAWEAVIGIGTGILVDAVNQTTAAEQLTGAALVEDFAGSGVLRALELIGGVAWLIAVAAAAIALRHALALSWGVVVLFVFSAPLITAHVPPFGPVGLALFITAVAIVVRPQRTGKGRSPASLEVS